MSSPASGAEEYDDFTEVVIVRHGETSWNAARIIQVPACFSSLRPLIFAACLNWKTTAIEDSY
jgi:hypothetical protein